MTQDQAIRDFLHNNEKWGMFISHHWFMGTHYIKRWHKVPHVDQDQHLFFECTHDAPVSALDLPEPPPPFGPPS